MEGDKKQLLSFGFTKKQDNVQLAKSAVSEDVDQQVHETDYVLSLEGKEVKSLKRSDKPIKREYIIPLIKHNKWRAAEGSGDNVNTDTPASLDQQALQEVLQDTARYNQEWVDRGQEDTHSVIPLLLQNKIPEGFESDERLDVALRPQEPSEADYQQVPIEQFGLAMLRGMGWSKDKGIGKNSKVTVPVEAHIRPKGLGLGADRNNSGPDKTNLAHNGVDDKGEELELKKSAHCVLTAGSNKDLYGTIEGIDEDNSRVMIKLALSGKVVNIMQSNVRVVGKPEFEKYSKYLNKQKTDEYKDNEIKRLENLEDGKHSDASKSQKSKGGMTMQSDSDSDVHSSRDKRSMTGDKRRYDDENQRRSKHKKRGDRTDKHSRQKVDSSLDCVESDERKHSRRETISWLRNDLRVRIIDRHLEGGRYYKDKAVIIDVPSQGMCVCRTDGGRVVENVPELSLETVVPRVEDACVAIVGGSHRGQIGHIMKRDKDKCLALVQLLADRDTLLRVPYNHICEYVGDVHQCHDY
ncbi:unnamed protein product [Candidula unifasciata]|uniref:G-patch domain-containing protein n=1 Tax=Candidula unifasciata TaxID=100452 RepID=A0A8S3Z897_9EUPU|nr:unnamed protein product [Candidula unifasciata]